MGPRNHSVGKHDSNISNFTTVYGRDICCQWETPNISRQEAEGLTGAAAAAALQAGAERVRKELQANLQVRCGAVRRCQLDVWTWGGTTYVAIKFGGSLLWDKAPNMADSKIPYNWRFVAEKIIELNNSICEKSWGCSACSGQPAFPCFGFNMGGSNDENDDEQEEFGVPNLGTIPFPKSSILRLSQLGGDLDDPWWLSWGTHPKADCRR